MSAASGLTRLRSAHLIGTKPSQRAARAIGRGAGSTPATQTGMRGRWTGAGVNRTVSTARCLPEYANGSPLHSPASTSRPSSSSSARSRSPDGSPKMPKSP